MTDAFKTSVKIIIESEKNHGGTTLQTAICRLLGSNNIPHEVTESAKGRKVLTVGTFPGIQQLLAYPFPENEFAQDQCHDAAGNFREPQS